MIKKLLIILGILSMTTSWALEDPLLVLDASNTDKLPRKFRFDNKLQAAGSAQFSEKELLQTLQKIHTKKVTIVDLRQESHGYVNGNAISWYGKHDAINAGLTSKEIEAREKGLLSQLANSKSVVLHDINKKSSSGSILATSPQSILIKEVLSENQLANKHHLQYKRIFVQDFHAPLPKAVDEFLLFARALSKTEWLYFHCRGGSGRTTTFMTMHDMLKNAKTDSFDSIMQRQITLNGKDLAKLPDPDEYKYPFALERLQFLKKFYEYAKSGSKQRWSDWLKQ